MNMALSVAMCAMLLHTRESMVLHGIHADLSRVFAPFMLNEAWGYMAKGGNA